MYNRRLKFGTVLLVGVALVSAFSSLGLAQTAQVMKDSAKMMSDAWKMFDQGQRMVIEGLEMNNQVAAQAGVQDLMNPGNKTIGSGRDSVQEGAKLFAQVKRSSWTPVTPRSLMPAGSRAPYWG